MSRRSREERQADEDARAEAKGQLAVVPSKDAAIPGAPAVFLSRFECSGMARTKDGYCVVTLVYGEDGKLEAQSIGRPQTWPQYVAKELVQQVKNSTNLLLDGKMAP